MSQLFDKLRLLSLVVICSVGLTHCKSKDQVAAIVSQTTSHAPTSGSPTQCATSVIDTGQKGNVASVARGSYSDTKIIPSTTSPATAFIDQTGNSIKISFFNGTSWTTEIVAGDGTGAFVRLAFTSNKIPFVFWTLGAFLKVAIRSAPLGTVGTWTGGIIDSGTAPRAVEVSVNPLDQIGVVFITDTAVAGRPKFLYCDTGCAGPGSFQAMTASPYLENTNVVAAETSTGAAWCKANASTFYPAATYSVTGVTKYAVCIQSNLANCLNGANWSTSQVVATGNVSTKLFLDPTVTGDVPKVVSLGAAGIVPYRMGTTQCTSAPITFANAGAAIGGATSGNQWMTLLMDIAGKFHLIANESTTSVRYYNSVGSDITGGFNAAGVIETVTTPAATSGGADIVNSLSEVWSSYGTNAAPFDLRLGMIDNYTVTSNAALYSRFTPDVSGDIQLMAASSQLKNIAMASSSTKIPAVAYVDFSVGTAAAAKLKYARRTGNSSTSSWADVVQVPDTINPQFPSLAFDENDKPWISYFEAATNRFYLVTNSAADGSGAWNSYEFPLTPAGAPLALPAANNTALAMYFSGGIANPVMVTIDTNAGSKGVKAALLNRNTRTFGTPSTIDGLTAGALGAAHLSADFDTSGNIVVGFQDLNTTSAKYSYSANATTWSSPLVISAAARGVGLTVKMNSATGKPAAAYYDQPNNTLYYASCTSTPSGCTSGGWTSYQVDTSVGISAMAAASGQILTPALSFNSTGVPYIYYPRGTAKDGNLAVATNSTGSFVSSVVANGVNAALTGAAALNFGVAGWGVAVAPNSSGAFTTAYVGPGNWLYSTSCGD